MYKIGVFFGIDQIELLMYMGWLGLLLILLTFLPFRYGILDSIIKLPKAGTDTNVSNAVTPAVTPAVTS